MKRNNLRLLLLAVLALVATVALNAQITPLEEGTYVISADPEVGDYVSFRAACEDLNERGVSGPVMFDVKPGTYNDKGDEKEQIVITDFPGSSEENRVTFVNNDFLAPAVIAVRTPRWSYDDPGRPEIESMVHFIGAKYVTFENLSFRRYSGNASSSIGLSADAEFIRVINCSFNYGGGSEGAIEARFIHNLHIEGSTFPEARIYIKGNPEDYTRGLVIKNNKFDHGSSAFLLDFVDSFIFSGNVIDMTGTGYSGRGGALVNTRGAYRFENNRIFGSSAASIGLLIGDQNPGGSHIDDGEKAIIANNMIGGNIDATGNYTAGIRVHATIHNVGFYYNSILVESASAPLYKQACIAFAMPNCTNIDIVNNSFANTGGGDGYLLVVSSTSMKEFDYNNYYSNGNRFILYNGVEIPNLPSLQSVDGKNMHSRVGNPEYITNTDLHTYGIQLWQAGTPIEGFDFDFDGDERDPEKPCIGADEYVPLIDNDLAAVSLTGPSKVTVGEPSDFEVVLENRGRLYQVSYEIRLMREGNILLGTYEIVEPIWNDGDPVTQTITWIPSYPGVFNIYAKVVLYKDENPGNDSTPSINVVVEPAPTSVDESYVNLETSLKGNYPNPFNPETSISFSLKEDVENLEIKIFNAQGQLIKTLIPSISYPRGEHSVVWNGTSDSGDQVPSGIYFYRMTTPGYSQNQKMMLLK